MKRESRCNVLKAKVPQPQEVDLGGLGHGHELHRSVQVGHAAHQIDQSQEVK